MARGGPAGHCSSVTLKGHSVGLSLYPQELDIFAEHLKLLRIHTPALRGVTQRRGAHHLEGLAGGGLVKNLGSSPVEQGWG